MMKRVLMFTLFIFLMALPLYADCQRDLEVDGYHWTFHRNDLGDAYHECNLNRMYREGTSLNLRVPCIGYHVDLIKVLWDDNQGKMSGNLVVCPGKESINSFDISSRHPKVTWEINCELKRLEVQFAGPRDQMAHVTWIRVYYGKTPHKSQPAIQNQQSSLPMVDRIKFVKGPKERRCRVLKWDGAQFILLIDRGGNRPIEREISVESIQRITFGPRWGHASGFNNQTVPFKAKRFKNGLIWFDKKEGDRVISKDKYPIEKFKQINFNK